MNTPATQPLRVPTLSVRVDAPSATVADDVCRADHEVCKTGWCARWLMSHETRRRLLAHTSALMAQSLTPSEPDRLVGWPVEVVTPRDSLWHFAAAQGADLSDPVAALVVMDDALAGRIRSQPEARVFRAADSE